MKCLVLCEKTKNGIPLVDLLNQLLCFFMDGTNRHLTQFDNLKKDTSYMPLIGCKPDHLTFCDRKTSLHALEDSMNYHLFTLKAAAPAAKEVPQK
jgi:hypothetical protein